MHANMKHISIMFLFLCRITQIFNIFTEHDTNKDTITTTRHSIKQHLSSQISILRINVHIDNLKINSLTSWLEISFKVIVIIIIIWKFTKCTLQGIRKLTGQSIWKQKYMRQINFYEYGIQQLVLTPYKIIKPWYCIYW